MQISLEKTGDSHRISLAKGGGTPQATVHVNLNWAQPKAGGFLSRFTASSAPDLDLGCMYETMDGEKGVIQPLGGNFGSKTASPYIFLDKDDRTGAAADGENMYLYRPELLKRVMLFAFIYEGAPDFRAVGGSMSFKVAGVEQVQLRLSSPQSNQRFCAAAIVSSVGSDVVVTKEERYFNGHQEADLHYGFGFDWVSGSK